MSLAARLIRGAGVRAQGRSISELSPGSLRGFDWGPTSSGELVSVDRALALPAVFAAIRMQAETMGAMPLLVYRKSGSDRQRSNTHPAYRLLHEQPNETMTAVEFWTLFFSQLVGWGEAFIGKQFAAGQLASLWPIPPWEMTVERRAGQLIYTHQPGTADPRRFSSQEIIHVRLFTKDGIRGVSPIAVARDAIGVGLAVQQHAGGFFRDAAVPSGALKVKQEIKDREVREALREEWEATHKGRNRIAILDAGAEFQPITIPMRDAQFVAVASLTVSDVARIYNMPASLLKGSTGDSLTYGNRESDAIQFLTFTLTNPLRKTEQALSNDADVFPKNLAFFCEFLVDHLLRADSATRAAFYTQALNPATGWMTRDEVRQRENLPEIPIGGEPVSAGDAAAAAGRRLPLSG